MVLLVVAVSFVDGGGAAKTLLAPLSHVNEVKSSRSLEYVNVVLFYYASFEKPVLAIAIQAAFFFFKKKDLVQCGDAPLYE